VSVLLIEVGDVLSGLGAGLLTDGVAAHAIGDNENVSTGRIAGGINRRAGRASVLVMTPLDAHIGQGGVPDRLKCRHERLPDWAY